MTEAGAPGRADPWRLAGTAAAYDEYVSGYPLYGATSRELAEAAGTSTAMRVADLGCGTGITTRAILGRVGPAGRVFALDSSPAMLAMARARISEPNVTWSEGPAERADELIGGPVDQVLCNMAFWQFDTGPALAAIGNLIGRGTLAFSLGYRRPLGAGFEVAAVADSWRRRLRASGFELSRCFRSRHHESAAAARAWLDLPLGRTDGETVDPGQQFVLHAIYLVCRYRAADAPR